MAIEMRELRGDDLFSLLAIVGKLDIKDEFVKMFERNVEATNVVPMDHQSKKPTKVEQAKIDLSEKEVEKRGMEMAASMLQKVLVNLKAIKYEVNELLADLTGLTLADIQSLGLKDYTTLLISFFKKPELKDFFESIASLL
ncbi:hypothetical protein FC84_GL001652 [Lapidilactobacillus dextrinicus DSM 20335]|uniref:Uncharacterized protein n=1 Tax=Lapidilactobacillus dextrinicus DSM 20335 TaxID=1423738 RepID=A0A0R2BK13_9LACO|nr:hypothetical protein [Lapidilactobacillus dextrinicus]KRM79472.1 hypothetical protein FC84_GL001652 [Lapidilactobacillus dextrinicus DSM 20335]QFG46693.1 hypothetical protein LH506_04200 [Lapidilactobacillus dextrinicus]